MYLHNKNQYQSLQRQKLLESRSNPQLFWQLIKRQDKKEKITVNISQDAFQNYFTSLLYDENYIEAEDILHHHDNISEDDLNRPVSEDEVISSIKNLNTGKSPGSDGIGSEFYKHTILDVAPLLTKIFNIVFDKGVFSKKWGESLTCPIYKSGSRDKAENYRGISLLNTMYKIMSSIVSNRLYIWAEENNKIDEGQAGFRRGYSTIDNIFTLQSIIQKYLSKSGGRLYCIYIDFSKAFDKIKHEKLFQSMSNKGIGGKFYRFLKLSYANHVSVVKTENGIIDFFNCNIGTKQGDVSSPIFFSLFINDLNELLREKCGQGIFINNKIPEILSLMFADDVACCADTANRLQKQINVIETFCSNTGMELNLGKTEIIVFRKGRYLRNYEKWFYNNKQIQTTSNTWAYYSHQCYPGHLPKLN